LALHSCIVSAWADVLPSAAITTSALAHMAMRYLVMTSSPVFRLKLKATGFTNAGCHSQRDNALAVDTLPWGAAMISRRCRGGTAGADRAGIQPAAEPAVERSASLNLGIGRPSVQPT
jgi:hypothetical protein